MTRFFNSQGGTFGRKGHERRLSKLRGYIKLKLKSEISYGEKKFK